jgi:hypothetical protein
MIGSYGRSQTTLPSTLSSGIRAARTDQLEARVPTSTDADSCMPSYYAQATHPPTHASRMSLNHPDVVIESKIRARHKDKEDRQDESDEMEEDKGH